MKTDSEFNSKTPPFYIKKKQSKDEKPKVYIDIVKGKYLFCKHFDKDAPL